MVVHAYEARHCSMTTQVQRLRGCRRRNVLRWTNGSDASGVDDYRLVFARRTSCSINYANVLERDYRILYENEFGGAAVFTSSHEEGEQENYKETYNHRFLGYHPARVRG